MLILLQPQSSPDADCYRCSDMNGQIGQRISLVNMVTNKIASSNKEQNDGNTVATATTRRSDTPIIKTMQNIK